MHDETTVLNGAKAIEGLLLLYLQDKKQIPTQTTEFTKEIARAVLDSLPKIEPADLVERLLDGFDAGAGYDKDSWRKYCPEDRRRFIAGMTAALSLFVNDPAVLGDPKDGELTDIECLYSDREAEGIRIFISNRRNRLLSPPEVKPWSERITVERLGASEHVMVLLDDKVIWQFDDTKGGDCGETHAERYRLGLLAQKEQENAR